MNGEPWVGRHRHAAQEAASGEIVRLQEALVDLELKGLSDEYNELADTWKQIDTKAQVTASVAGVFLGGVFAIQRTPNLVLPPPEIWFLAAALTLLVLSIISAIMGLQLRDISFPPRGVSHAEIFDSLYGTEEFLRGGSGLLERRLRHKQQQVGLWRQVNAKTLKILTSKGKCTLAAQWLFAIGVSVFAFLSIYELVLKLPIAVEGI